MAEAEHASALGELAALQEAPSTKDRPFAEVLADAVQSAAKPKARARAEQAVAQARERWGTTPSAEVDPDSCAQWVGSLGPRARVDAMGLLFGALSRVRILEAAAGSRVVAGDFYANPVWTVEGAHGLGVAGAGMAATSAILRASGARGSDGTVAAQLKKTLGKNQYIWFTDTSMVFVGSTRTRFTGAPQVRAVVPLEEVAAIKKAPRLQLLARFSIRFADGSRASFMSWPGHVRALQQAYAATAG